jgi:hypothetical protein
MRKYSIFSIIFIILSGFFIYINSNETTTMAILGINISLPNAIWMMGFLLLFFIFSIGYAFILRYKSFRFENNILKDIKVIKENIKFKMLGINKFNNTKELNNINEFIKNISYLNISTNFVEDFEFLNEIDKIKNGEVVDLKKYKLSEDNEWVILNKSNKLNQDNSYVKTILNTSKNESLIKQAQEIIIKNKDLNQILEFNIPLTKEIIIENIESEKLNILLKNSDLEKSDYIEIAKEAYKIYDNPETLFELFEAYHEAYIYLLIEFEVIDKALEVAKEYESKFFEYYLLLREDGHKIDIKDFLNDRFF